MADNSVFITGVANGAFGEALQTLPPWATEKTANKISGILKEQVKILNDMNRNLKDKSGNSPGMSSDSLKKYNSELDKAVGLLTRHNTAEADAIAFAKHKKELEKEKYEKDKAAVLGIKKFSSVWDKARFVLAGVAQVGSKLLDVDKKYIKTTTDLYQSGINLMSGNDSAAESMLVLQDAVKTTRVPMDKIAETAQKYSSSFNAVGFTKFYKAANVATEGLKDLAYSGPEAVENLGVYLETMQGFTNVRNESEKDLGQSSAKFGATLGALSLQMGISRKNLTDSMIATSKTVDTMFTFASKGKVAAENMVAWTASIKDQNLKHFLESVSASINPTNTAGGRALQDVGLGSELNQIAQIVSTAQRRGGETANKDAAELIKHYGTQIESVLQLHRESENPNAAVAAEIWNGFKQTFRNVGDATDEQTKKAIASQSSLSKLDTAVNASKAAVEAAFPPLESQVRTLTNSLEALNKVAYKIIENTNTEARSWMSATAVMASFVAVTLLPMVGKIGSAMNLFGAASGTIANAANAASKLGSLAKGLGAVGAVVTAGTVGYGLGEAVVKPLIDAGIKQLTGGKSLSLGDGIYNLLNKDVVDPKSGTRTPITVSKTPAPSTINSPSAVPVTPQSESNNSAPSAGMPATPMAPGIDKSPSSADISNALAAHTNILQQILQASADNVSVNKDILMYARNST